MLIKLPYGNGFESFEIEDWRDVEILCAGTDAGMGADTDAGAGVGAGVDVDAGVDVSTYADAAATVDADADAGTDVGVGADAGVDVSTYADAAATVDAGADAGTDAGVGAAADAGAGLGADANAGANCRGRACPCPGPSPSSSPSPSLCPSPSPGAIPSPGPGADSIVRTAMASPIESPRLSKLAERARNAVVICSDHTRPVPSQYILPHILGELREGNPHIDITLLIATGMHRAPTRGELEQKLGKQIMQSEKIIIHDSRDNSAMRNIGRLPSGADLIINRIAAETDLLVAEGFIEPHFFAGFSGGRKSILPGICSYETVLGNHCSKFIADPAARTGSLDKNPINRDMMAAQRIAHLKYIVNVIIDGNKQVLQAFAGAPDAAHAKGCKALAGLCRVKPKRLADIVITTNGGAPLDQNIYQAVKCMTAAESAAAPGAVIIALSECADGTGCDTFMRLMRDCESPAALLAAIERVPMDKTVESQWQAQILARILMKHPIILVCSPEARDAARCMKLQTADDINEAFELALCIKKKYANRGTGLGEMRRGTEQNSERSAELGAKRGVELVTEQGSELVTERCSELVMEQNSERSVERSAGLRAERPHQGALPYCDPLITIIPDGVAVIVENYV